MYINSIEIENFRSFYGKNKLNFNFEDKNNYNVIFGKNGTGKSVFIESIYWCLYGDLLSNKYKQSLCNYDVIRDNDEINVVVICRFNIDDGILEVKREANFNKNNKSEINLVSSNFIASLSILKDDDVETKYIDEYLLFNYFPKFLFSLLFYDVNYWDLEKHCEVTFKKIFEKFSMFDVIDNVNKHIHNMAQYYIKESRKIAPRSNFLIERKGKLQEIDIKINNTQDEINSAHKNKYLLEQELSNYLENDDKKLYEAYYKMSILSNELKSLETHILRLRKERKQLLIKSFPLIQGFSNVSTEAIVELEKLLSNRSDLINTRFYNEFFNIKELLLELPNSESIKNISMKIHEIQEVLEKKHYELECLNSLISNIDDSHVIELQNQINNYKKSIKLSEMKLFELKSYKKSLVKQLSHDEKEIKNLEQDLQSILLKINFCDNGFEFGNQLKEKLVENMLNELNNTVNKIFIDDFEMNNKFEKIIIDKLFHIKLVKNSNQLISTVELSSSEKKLLNLALIISIYSHLKLDYPLIFMDPFINLDDEKINKIISVILNKNFNNQILLILNNNQYSDLIKNRFLRNNVKVYELIEYNGNTEVFDYES